MGKLLVFPSQAIRPNGEHIFVKNLCFWSMLAIIATHSITLAPLQDPAHPLLTQILITPLQFATISLSLLTGFLLAERTHQGPPLAYVLPRMQKVLLPWLLWFSAAVALLLLLNLTWNRAALASGAGPLFILGHWSQLSLVSSSFWLVPDLVAALALLLAFRRHLHRRAFGLLLLAVNLFYAVNLYTGWVATHHAEAILGVVLYLWIGALAARHRQQLLAAIDLTPFPALLLITLLAALLAFTETRLLSALGSTDSLNPLRLTNQIFSVLAVLLFLKLRQTLHPSFVHVRNHTLGLYLSHSFLIIALSRAFESHQLPRFVTSTLGRLALAALSFVAVYSTCLLIVRSLANHPRLQWTVGISTSSSRLRASAEVIPVWTLKPSRDISDATAR